jgi:hypothetical protein
MDAKKVLTSMLGLPETATEEDCGRAMAKLTENYTPADWRATLVEAFNLRDQLRPGTSLPTAASDDPQAAFHALAERTSKVLGISLSDAYSRVAREAPALYERARTKAML